MTTPKSYILLFNEVVPDIQPFVGHPCVRFRNGKFEISPFQLRFGRLGVPTATRNDMVGPRVEMGQDGTRDRMRAHGTLGIRITKKEALDALEALSLKMIQAKISLEEESRQPFITRKHMSRVRKADPEMTGGNRQIVDGSEASPSHEGFFTRV